MELGGVYNYSIDQTTGKASAVFRSDKIKYLKLPSELYFDYTNGNYNSLTYEMDVALYNTASTGNYRRIFTFSENWNATNDKYTGFSSDGYSGNLWKLYIAGTKTDLQNQSAYLLNGKTFSFKIEKKPNDKVDLTLRVYQGATDYFIYSATNQNKNVIEDYQSAISLSSHRNYADMEVYGVRIITG